jgi:hypothetical protein
MHKPTKKEMFGRDSASPLRKADIRAGLDRLMASDLMTNPAGRVDTGHGFTETLDAVNQFRGEGGKDVSEIVKSYGVDREVRSVIESLAFELVMSRLTEAEIFRLGTSEEAIRLFEESDAWQDVLSRHSPEAVSA